jgi:hypothetical protein
MDGGGASDLDCVIGDGDMGFVSKLRKRSNCGSE